jgi:hypothetical protein
VIAVTIVGIFGNLGSGKTLSLVYYAVLNKYKHGKDIYSNIDLAISHYRIRSLDQFRAMHDGFAVMDEIWKFCDARRSSSQANKLITEILSASRKRGMDIGYTAQYFKSADIRLRSVTDLFAMPRINDNGICTLEVYDSDFRTLVETKRFPAAAIFPLYNTNEIVDNLKGLPQKIEKKKLFKDEGE